MARIKYTPALATRVCEQIAAGLSLRQIGEIDGLPSKSAILEWLSIHPEFADQYAHARTMQAEHFADEILEIADDGTNDWTTRETANGPQTALDAEHVQRSRLRVDARKWLMSKMAPKKYGDKITQEVTGKDGAPMVPVLNVFCGSKPPSSSETG